jgi:NitT/TauT family transport system permease protein
MTLSIEGRTAKTAATRPPAMDAPARRLAGTIRPPRSMSRVAELAVGPAILIGAWWVLFATEAVDPNLLPSPFATLAETWTNLVNGSLLHDAWRTLERVLIAFAIAAVLGVPIGIALGANATVYRCVEFLIDFFRSTPATAMFPLFLLIFGLGDFSKIAVAAFAAWLLIVFNTAYGVMNARPTRLLAARSMGASPLRSFRDVIFYETLPQTLVGLRAAISLGLVVIVVAEMFIGAVDGMGKRIIDAQISYELTDMYGSILVAGALGYLLNLFFIAFERQVVHWSGK